MIIFVTGGTGYIGRRLIKILLGRGHGVTALVRAGSAAKVPPGAKVVVGNPFEADDFTAAVPMGCTFVQLLGVAHPSPGKREQFVHIDLRSARQSAEAARRAGAGHFVYVSVAATPTTIMRDYQQARALGEAAIRETGLPHTFLRPWYVLGPGHWWPALLWPFYKILEWLPTTRAKARDLGLVTLLQMLRALVWAIEHPPLEERILDVPGITSLSAG